MKIDKWYRELLVCPLCGAAFSSGKEDLICKGCGLSTRRTGHLDLRVKGQKNVKIELQLSFDAEAELLKVDLTRPRLTYKGPVGMRYAGELLSVLEQTVTKPGRVLDLGCGPRDQAEAVKYLGHQYVGIDFTSNESDILADAHALPFANASFDFVLSYAVLEHLHNPFLALLEVKRVLKPGCIFVGTVSQGEPFHDSFFHLTTWGVLSLVCATGMELLRLWPCWDTLTGLAEMGRYPRILKHGIRAIDWAHRRCPFLAPRKMKWSTEQKRIDELHRAASLGFVIQSPL
jgi:SAM-dependent methyltransferase